jgi:hypothetical protein
VALKTNAASSRPVCWFQSKVLRILAALAQRRQWSSREEAGTNASAHAELVEDLHLPSISSLLQYNRPISIHPQTELSLSFLFGDRDHLDLSISHHHWHIPGACASIVRRSGTLQRTASDSIDQRPPLKRLGRLYCLAQPW